MGMIMPGSTDLPWYALGMHWFEISKVQCNKKFFVDPDHTNTDMSVVEGFW